MGRWLHLDPHRAGVPNCPASTSLKNDSSLAPRKPQGAVACSLTGMRTGPKTLKLAMTFLDSDTAWGHGGLSHLGLSMADQKWSLICSTVIPSGCHIVPCPAHTPAPPSCRPPRPLTTSEECWRQPPEPHICGPEAERSLCGSLVANNTFLFVAAKSWVSDCLGVVPEASS